MRRAIDELLAQGVILVLPGNGLYAGENKQPAQLAALLSFSKDMVRRGMTVSSRILEGHVRPATPALASRKEIETGAELVYLRRLILSGAHLAAIQANWLVHEMWRELLSYDLVQPGLYPALRAEYNLMPATETTFVEAILAEEEEASLLELDLPTVLLVTEQLTRCKDGRIFDLARTVFFRRPLPVPKSGLTETLSPGKFRPRWGILRRNGFAGEFF